MLDLYAMQSFPVKTVPSKYKLASDYNQRSHYALTNLIFKNALIHKNMTKHRPCTIQSKRLIIWMQAAPTVATIRTEESNEVLVADKMCIAGFPPSEVNDCQIGK